MGRDPFLRSGQNNALPGRRTGRARKWMAEEWVGAAPISTTAQSTSCLIERRSCCAFRPRKSNDGTGCPHTPVPQGRIGLAPLTDKAIVTMGA